MSWIARLVNVFRAEKVSEDIDRELAFHLAERLCCVNVGGLMLSKLHERRHEFAVRTAIGAAGMRIARQYLTEAFLIALAGAALGAAIAWYGTPWLLPFFRSPMAGTGMKLEPDQTVFLVTELIESLRPAHIGPPNSLAERWFLTCSAASHTIPLPNPAELRQPTWRDANAEQPPVVRSMIRR